MRLLATADFHGKRTFAIRAYLYARDKNVDAITIAGDIVHKSSLDEAKRILSVFKDIPVLFVPGNTDPPELCEYSSENLINLHGRSYSFEGVTFFGVGGSLPTPFYSTFTLSEEDIEKILDARKTAVLVTHTPPYGLKISKTWRGEIVGSKKLRQYIETFQPLLNICGHIHEHRGIDKIGATICINTGQIPHAYIIEIKGNDVIPHEVYIPPLVRGKEKLDYSRAKGVQGTLF